MDAVDWRTQLQLDSRLRIVNKIMETLMRHLPFSGQEGIMELNKIAERFEEKIYSAATSQSDYLRKISMKMLAMECKSQGTIPNSCANSSKSQDAGGAEQSMYAVDWRTQLRPDSRQRTIYEIMETLKRLHPSAGLERILEVKKFAEQFEEKIFSVATSQDDYLKKLSMKRATLEAEYQDTIPCPLSSSYPSCSKLQDSGASSDFTARAGNDSGGDWQEEVYRKIKAMKAIYFPELNNLYQNVASKTQKHDSPPHQLCQKLDKQKISKKTLDRLFAFLLVSRNDVLPIYKENLWSYEMEILNILESNMPLKTGPSTQQGKLGQSLKQSMHLVPKVHPPESQTSSRMQSMNSQASLDSKARKGNVGGNDWQEEVYQQIKAMKEMYLPELNGMYQKIAAKLHQHDSLPQQPKSEQLEKLKIFKKMLERIIAFLQVSKNNVLPGFKEKLASYEMQILNCLDTNRPRKLMPSMQQGQLVQPHMHQSQPLIPQFQPHGNQINPQMQQSQPSIPQFQPHGNQINPQMQQSQPSIPQFQPYGNQINPQMQHLQPFIPHFQPHGSQINPQTQQSQSSMPQFQPHGNRINPQIQQSQPFIPQFQPHGNPINPQMQQSQPFIPQFQPHGNQINPQMLQSQPIIPHFQPHGNGINPQMQQPQPLIPQFQPHGSQINPQMQSMNTQASLDSTAPKENVGGGDWQEEVYQKIKAMKEMYLPELNDMYQKIVTKLQQLDSLPQHPESEMLDKLKMFRKLLEHSIAFLQVSKNNVLPGFKEKLSAYEMQIMNCLNTNRSRKPMPSMQQGGQLEQSHVQSIQQSQPLIRQAQPHENQINPQMQSMNSLGASEMITQIPSSSLPGISVPQQNMVGSLQNLAVGNQPTSTQWVTSGPIQQDAASASQQRKRSRTEE